MNISKGTLISVVIVIATLAIGFYFLFVNKGNFLKSNGISNDPLSSVQLKFGDKNFKLDSSAYTNGTIIDIAKFDKSEEWKGKVEFDEINFWTGTMSLLLSSKDNEKIDAYLLKNLNLDKTQVFKAIIYLQSDPSDIENVRLYFGNKDKTSYFAYPITGLVKGWNFIRIPKIKFSPVNATKDSLNGKVASGQLNWDKIERVGLELSSRSNSIIDLNLDSVTAYKDEDYLDNWLMTNPLFLDLANTPEGKTVYQAKNIGGSLAIIKKISGVSDFTFKAKVSPQKKNARSGLVVRGDYKSGYGYYFLVDGLGGNRWQILKIDSIGGKVVNDILKNGVINNFAVEKDKPLWLKVEAKGNSFKFYLSNDSNSYTLLGEVKDGSIKEGSVGITVYDSGVTQFDEFEFSQ